MKVGIYGGTFDPPHLGHMRAAQAALAQLELDELIFVPAHIPPHKEQHPDSATAEDRLAMTALMADGMQDPRVKVSDVELRRTGKSPPIPCGSSMLSGRRTNSIFSWALICS